MIKGLFCAFAACLLWGTTYVVPCFLTEFSPSEILLGRYLAFGLVSLLLFLRKWKILKSEKDCIPSLSKVLQLAVVGFFLYDLLEITNIRVTGSETVGLIYGATLIVSSSLINLKTSLKSRPYVWLEMGFLLCGLFILERESWDLIFQGHYWMFGWGIAILQGALWIYFTKTMSRFTDKFLNPEQIAAHITILIGITCLILSLSGWGCFVIKEGGGSIERYFTSYSTKDWTTFALISLISGIGATWLATQLWCTALIRLPHELILNFLLADLVAAKIYEQLISGETLSVFHSLGIAIILGGGIVIRRLRAKKRVDKAELCIFPVNSEQPIASADLLSVKVSNL